MAEAEDKTPKGDENLLGKTRAHPLTTKQVGRWYSATWKVEKKARALETKKAAKETALVARSQIVSPRPDLTGDETGLPLTRPPFAGKEKAKLTVETAWPPKNEILRAVEASKARGEKPEQQPEPTPRRILGIRIGKGK